MIVATCPVCGAAEQNELFEKDGHSYISCPECDLIRVYPQPSDEELDRIYRKGYYSVWGGEESSFLAMKHFLFSKLFQQYPILKNGHGKVLCDIGAATGILMEVAGEFGYDAYGIECSDDGAEIIRNKFGDAHILHDYFGNNNFVEIGWQNKFDVVVMYDLFEHVRDINAALDKTAELLKADGVVVIVSPDTSSFSCRFSGSEWPHFIPEHLFQFNKNNLSLLLKKHGFTSCCSGNVCKYLSLNYFSGVAQKEYPGVCAKIFSGIVKLLPQYWAQNLYFPFWCGTMIGIFRKSDQG